MLFKVAKAQWRFSNFFVSYMDVEQVLSTTPQLSTLKTHRKHTLNYGYYLVVQHPKRGDHKMVSCMEMMNTLT